MLMRRGDGVECSALFGFRSNWIDYDFRDIEAHRRLVLEAFAGEDAWKVPAILDDVRRSTDLYFDSVSQIRMPRWTTGSTAVVRDAGYCASFFSGTGTSLAMVGAALLAQEIEAAGHDLSVALPAYERAMNPIVEEAQAMASDGADILFPITAEGIEARNTTLRQAVKA
jgi:2-polyprenyl-6-methoxyphenol hydroxylase-like FAD-dependent oxidoreductase